MMPRPARQSSLHDYHQWLDANTHAPRFSNESLAPQPFALTLYRDPGAGARSLGIMVASYLNEVDPIAPGRWAAFDETALSDIVNHQLESSSSDDPKNASITRFPLTEPKDQRHAPREQSMLNLVSTGAVVLVDNDAHRITLDHPRVFHVRLAGSDSPEAATTQFHLTVNTERMSQHTAVRVIADSALEWAVQSQRSSQA